MHSILHTTLKNTHTVRKLDFIYNDLIPSIGNDVTTLKNTHAINKLDFIYNGLIPIIGNDDTNRIFPSHILYLFLAS